MPTPEWAAKARAALASPGVSPELKARLEGQLAEYDRRAAAAGGGMSGGAGQAQGPGGAPAPADDPLDALKVDPKAPDVGAPQRDWTETVPEMGRAVLAGLDRSITGGLATRLADAVDPGTKQRLDAARAAHPYLSTGGGILGALGPGLANLIGKGAAAGAGMKAGQGLFETMGRGLVAGGAGGGAQAGIEAAVAGEPWEEAVNRGTLIGGLFGPVAAALGYGGNKLAQKLRDPRTPQGRDLQLAEKGGAKTSVVSGLEPGPQVAELAEEGTRMGGVSPESVAAERAAPVLGGELQSQMGKTLSSIKMQNEAMYESGAETTLRPLLKKQLGVLRDATHKGVLLPGKNVDEVVRAVEATAQPKVVPRTSLEAHGAEADEMMDVGLARHLGIVKGGATAADAENVVVFEPRSVDARAIDTTARSFDQRANVKAGNYDPAKEPAKQMAAGAREAREGLGPEWAEAKANQSAALTRMKNQLEASGLPRESEAVDLGDFGTMDALYRAVRRYRTEGNLVADRELDRLATGNAGLRELLDTYAGTAATQRLRGQADLEFTPGGSIRPHGLTGAAKLHLDPLMQWLGRSSMTPVPGLSTTAAEQRKGGGR